MMMPRISKILPPFMLEYRALADAIGWLGRTQSWSLLLVLILPKPKPARRSLSPYIVVATHRLVLFLVHVVLKAKRWKIAHHLTPLLA